MVSAITVFYKKKQSSVYENLITIDFFIVIIFSYCGSRTNFYLTTICPLKEIHTTSNNPDCSSSTPPPHTLLSLSQSLSVSLFNAHISTIRNKYDFWLNITLFASSVVFSYLVPHFSGFVVKLCIKVNVKTWKICNLQGAPFYSLLQWRLSTTVRELGMCSAWRLATQQGSTKPLSLFSQDEPLIDLPR